jgi:hypothetical protein
MSPGHPLLWRDRADARAEPRVHALRAVAGGAARAAAGERESAGRDDARREREYHPYGLMAWWPER